MSESISTFCRICEPTCGLQVELDADGAPARVTPDVANPAGGIACHKGLSFLDQIHNDPDRTRWPMKRQNPCSEEQGEFARVTWDAAFEEIGARLRAIREQHGPNAVAIFAGNPGAFNSTYALFAAFLKESLGTAFRFTSNTQDTSNKMAMVAEVYGSPTSFMIPDLENTDYLLCIGSNPKVSRWTLISAANDWDVVKDITRRGGKVRFVNPRVTESSTVDTGPTLQIRPGTDVYFLAALLNEVERLTGFDADIVARYGLNVDALRAFLQPYSAETVAGVTGIDADAIRTVAREFVEARSGIVYMATGVNQGRQGVLAAWLVDMLQFVTGNLGRRGGTYKPNGLALDCLPVSGVERVETSQGAFEVIKPGLSIPLPANILAPLIASGEIKALIVIAGNPLLTVAGEDAARAAFEKLDLLVTLDIFRNATGELADFVLPTVDFLERQDINLLSSGMQQRPHVSYTPPVYAPAFERREDWWVLSRMLQAAGLGSPLDADPDGDWGTHAIEKLLARKGLSIEALRDAPSGTVLLEPLPYDALFEVCLKLPHGKIDCFPEGFVAASLFDRFEQIFAELRAEAPDTLKLISLRTPYMHNSWLANAPKFRKGKERENPLHMSPADADRLSLMEGDLIELSSDFGTIQAHILLDDTLRPGAVAMSHGYGQGRTFALKTARENGGSNCNALMPRGAGSIEPLSHMSWLSAVPVTVRRCRAPQVSEPVGADARKIFA